MAYIYKDFLTNKNIYRWLKTYWKNEIEKLFENEVYIFDYYVSDKFDNGKLFYDGNPIYSRQVHQVKKSFRIIQEDPDEFDDYYTKFINEKGRNVGEYDEMVIVLTLTKENKNQALKDIKEWISK